MLDSTIGSIKVCVVMNTCEGSVPALDSCSLLETTLLQFSQFQHGEEVEEGNITALCHCLQMHEDTEGPSCQT